MPRHPYPQELADAILEARTILQETNDRSTAAAVLADVMTPQSVSNCLDYRTFRYVAMIPESHPLKADLRARDAAKQRRSYHTRKHRAAVIERDGGRCQRCGKEVSGRNATLDHIDPNGPSEPENLRLFCRSCNSSKSRLSDQQVAYRDERRVAWQQEMAREDEFHNCPCTLDGCAPDCPGCWVCKEVNQDELGNHPQRIICRIVTGILAESGFEWSRCETESQCRQAARCLEKGSRIDTPHASCP